jgi:hypothetical protein
MDVIQLLVKIGVLILARSESRVGAIRTVKIGEGPGKLGCDGLAENP